MKVLLVGKNSLQARLRRHKKRAGRDSHHRLSRPALFYSPPLALRQGAVVALLAVQRPENVGEHFFLGCGGLEVHGIP